MEWGVNKSIQINYMQNIFVVIPAYNEEKKIRGVVEGVLRVAPHVVVVDDGSNDETAKSVANMEGVRVLRHIINRGYGAATKTGIAYALSMGADVVVTFDADGQHRPEDVPALLAPIHAGFVDVVLGTRFHKNALKVPFLRKFSLKLAVVFTRIISGLRLTDAHNGLRAFSRKSLEKIDFHKNGMSAASEILDEVARHKLLYQEVPVVISYTPYSVKKGQSTFKKIMLGLDFIGGKITRLYHK
ncbi:MAG: Glycosyl transferase family 2 [Parcubacteria group bacterium GW2011_GWA2_44_12]|nr:MAG: Glycosyl transferase family 2 [Parcubacteria group bacterium GW2011_GWA2_44_12]